MSTSSAASVSSRKYGLNLLQSSPFFELKNFNIDTKNKTNSNSNSNNNNSTTETNRNTSNMVSDQVVEKFLDDNNEFLEDYVKRKISRTQLEKWFFANQSHTPKQPSSIAEKIKKQRSRSFTPLRKLSAATFEENGLSTPILTKDGQGRPSFLKPWTKIFPSSSHNNTNEINNKNNHQVPRPDSPNCSSASLFHILEKILLDGSTKDIFKGHTICELKKLLESNHISLFYINEITDQKVYNGTLYINDQNDCYESVKYTADEHFIKTIELKKTFLRTNPGLTLNGTNIKHCILSPIINNQNGKVMAVLCISRINEDTQCFNKNEENIFNIVSRFTSIALSNYLQNEATRLELTRSELFLDLARNLFSEQTRIEPTVRIILVNFLSMIECESCQILLTDLDENPDKKLQKLYELCKNQLNENGEVEESTSLEGKLPINMDISNKVAKTGLKINIPNIKDYAGNDPNLSHLTHTSMLCIPIKDSSSDNLGILGVICLINKECKETGDIVGFTENDERFAEAFSLFCAMAIRNAAEFENASLSEAKLQVAFDIMNYQASSSEEETSELIKSKIPSSNTLKIDRFEYSYVGLPDHETYKATLRMFTDLGLLSHFNIDYKTFCRWILTVKKNYRNDTVAYHNWYHAFNVTQMMFCMLKKSGWDKIFSKIECLGIMIACLNHDLDHRGTTNSFQKKSNSPLATLYSSSTLERHHLNRCLMLLHLPDNEILDGLSESDYSRTLSVIERCILATDLAQHFRNLDLVTDLVQRQTPPDFSIKKERFIVHDLLMTAADLGASTKPWDVHYFVSQLIAAEFWAQGDLERSEFHETPDPMMDREASLAKVQTDFLVNICHDVYFSLTKFNCIFKPLLIGCEENKKRWQELEIAKEKVNQNSLGVRGAARNL